MEINPSFDADILDFDIDQYLTFDTDTANLGFEQHHSPNFPPGVVELGLKELCPRAQPTDEDAQNPLVEDTQLTGAAASLDPGVDSAAVPSSPGSTGVRPLEPVVQASEAGTVFGEDDLGESDLLAQEENIQVV